MGFNQLYRFAAVEVAGADFKAKAVSLVMVGGIVSGTLGPFIAAQGKDWIDHAPFAGGILRLQGFTWWWSPSSFSWTFRAPPRMRKKAEKEV